MSPPEPDYKEKVIICRAKFSIRPTRVILHVYGLLYADMFSKKVMRVACLPVQLFGCT